MRLTEKGKRIKFVYGRGSAKSPNYEQIIDAQRYNKLAELEDIEEQLGCPLEVVFKALKDGIFVEKYNNIYDLKLAKYKTGFCLENENHILSITNYKKTWWLKKDKSE